MRFKNTNELKKGDIVAVPSYDEHGRILINQNVELTQFLIKRLKEEQINGIYIYDSLSEGINPHSNLSITAQMTAAAAVKDINIDECMYLSSTIAKLLENVDCIYTNVNTLAKYDVGTYMHSVNVATYAGIMGMTLGMSYEKIKNLIATGLMHDIGKSNIDKAIIDKPGKLTKDEYEIIKNHARYGYEMLKNVELVPSVVRVSILQHHENYDGTGYPNQLMDNDIYEFAKIIHICDVYEAMISKRSYKDTINPADVIEYIMANSGTLFNPGLVRIFLKTLIPYPEGVLVILSNGEKAIVSKINKNFPTRPEIRLFNGENIDLTKRLDITIKNIIV